MMHIYVGTQVTQTDNGAIEATVQVILTHFLADKTEILHSATHWLRNLF